MITVLICIIFGLIGLMCLLMVQAHRERKDLYNRIMSGSVKEYKQIDTNNPVKSVKSAHDKVIDKWRHVDS